MDGVKVTVIGLNEILAELYASGKRPNPDTAQEMLRLLQMAKNYIPASEVVRREYAHILLQEYKDYVAERELHSG